MLLPRGNERGMEFDLFVMLTNGDQDYVRPVNPPRQPGECKPAPIYCGRLNDTYPDARPMGYPFDRRPYSHQHHPGDNEPVESIEAYTYGIPNMVTVPITIQHMGRGGSAQQGGQVQFQDDRRYSQQQPGRGKSNGPINFGPSNLEKQPDNLARDKANDASIQEVPLLYHTVLTSALQKNPSAQVNFETGSSSNYYNLNNFRQWIQPLLSQGYKSESYLISKANSYAFRA